MILYDLKCSRDHRFEGWFRDGAAYDAQAAAKEICCPACGDRKVDKAPMAPRIGRGGGKSGSTGGDKRPKQADLPAAVAKQLAELRKKVESSCDYVGDHFAEEARRIHYGEADPHSIYGEATDEEAEALSDEGVEFARIPWIPRHDA